MVPSERCERLIPNAEKTLQSLLALTQEEIFDPARLTKNFRLGIVDNAFFSIFLPVVNEIQRAAPGVTFEIPDIRFSALTKYVDYCLPMKWICLSTRTKTVKFQKASVFSNFLKITLSTSPAKVTRWKRFRLKKFTFMSTITRKYEFQLARNFSFLTQAISRSIFQAVSAS